MLPGMKDLKDKAYWEKPENWTGLFLGGGILAFLGFGLYKLLPFVITLLENAIYATALGVVAFVLFVVLTDPKFWQIGRVLYKRAMWHITNSLIIPLDPIGILNDFVEGLHKKVHKMDEQISALSGMIRQLKERIAENVKVAAENMRLGSRAQKEKKKSAFVLAARKAGRRRETNKDLQEVLVKMEILHRVINKMREAAVFYIEDITDQVEVATKKYESIRAAYKAMKMAQRIIQGDRDTELFLQTMDYLAKDYGQKLGEIEQFINMSSNFIESVDLQNGVYEEEAIKMLEEWEKKGESLILGDTKSSLIQQAYDPGEELDLEAPLDGARQEVRKTDFGKLFN